MDRGAWRLQSMGSQIKSWTQLSTHAKKKKAYSNLLQQPQETDIVCKDVEGNFHRFSPGFGAMGEICWGTPSSSSGVIIFTCNSTQPA